LLTDLASGRVQLPRNERRESQLNKSSGTTAMILKLFSPKNVAKILAFFAQTTVTFCKKIDHNIGFLEKRHFFAENWQKSQKIVIIPSTPG
jgi:hypothetical protein